MKRWVTKALWFKVIHTDLWRASFQAWSRNVCEEFWWLTSHKQDLCSFNQTSSWPWKGHTPLQHFFNRSYKVSETHRCTGLYGNFIWQIFIFNFRITLLYFGSVYAFSNFKSRKIKMIIFRWTVVMGETRSSPSKSLKLWNNSVKSSTSEPGTAKLW